MTRISIVLDGFCLVFATSTGLLHIWRESSQLRADWVNAAAELEGAVCHCDVSACPISSLWSSPKSLFQTFMTDLLQHYNFTLWRSVWYIKNSQIVMEWKKILVVKLYLSHFKGHKGVLFFFSHITDIKDSGVCYHLFSALFSYSCGFEMCFCVLFSCLLWGGI